MSAAARLFSQHLTALPENADKGRSLRESHTADPAEIFIFRIPVPSGFAPPGLTPLRFRGMLREPTARMMLMKCPDADPLSARSDIGRKVRVQICETILERIRGGILSSICEK